MSLPIRACRPELSVGSGKAMQKVMSLRTLMHRAKYTVELSYGRKKASL